MAEKPKRITDVSLVTAKLTNPNGARMHVGSGMGWRIERSLDGLPDLEFIILAANEDDLRAIREHIKNYRANDPRFADLFFNIAIVQQKDIVIKAEPRPPSPPPPPAPKANDGEDW